MPAWIRSSSWIHDTRASEKVEKFSRHLGPKALCNGGIFGPELLGKIGQALAVQIPKNYMYSARTPSPLKPVGKPSIHTRYRQRSLSTEA